MNALLNFAFGMVGIAVMYLAEWAREGKSFSLKGHIADASIATVVIALLAYFFRAANVGGWLPHLIFTILGGASKYGVSWIINKTAGK